MHVCVCETHAASMIVVCVCGAARNTSLPPVFLNLMCVGDQVSHRDHPEDEEFDCCRQTTGKESPAQFDCGALELRPPCSASSSS